MALGQLTGTPWHVGKFTRAEGMMISAIARAANFLRMDSA